MNLRAVKTNKCNKVIVSPMEKVSKEYAKIFTALDFEKEVLPLATTCDVLLSRIAEFEALLSGVKSETSEVMVHLNGILSFEDQFRELQGRIDDLGKLTDLVSENMDALEHTIDIAEDELNVTDYSLRGLLLRPLLSRVGKSDANKEQKVRSNLKDGVFQPVPIFKASDFFVETKSTTNEGMVVSENDITTPSS